MLAKIEIYRVIVHSTSERATAHPLYFHVTSVELSIFYFILTFADGCGERTAKTKNTNRKDGASIPKRRVSDGNKPLSSEFMIRSRPSSFHDAELTTVPEVTVSPYEEDNASEDSSRSPSPTSRVS